MSDESDPDHAEGGLLDDVIYMAGERFNEAIVRRLGEWMRECRRSTPPLMEESVFASKFELPDYFGARVTAIYEHLTEAQSTENNRSRREALRKGLIESCSLLRDIDMGAVSMEIEQILNETPSMNDIPPPPSELERFLRTERRLLMEVGVSGAAIEDIDRLIRQLGDRPRKIITPDDMVVRFRHLQDLICTRSDEASAEAKAIGARSTWFGVAGAALVILNAGTVTVAPPVAALSLASGGALIGRAIG